MLANNHVAVRIQPGAQPYGYPPGPQGYLPPPAGAQYGMAPPAPAMYGPPPTQQPSTYVVQGGFDAGARFDGISKPNIPVSFYFIC